MAHRFYIFDFNHDESTIPDQRNTIPAGETTIKKNAEEKYTELFKNAYKEDRDRLLKENEEITKAFFDKDIELTREKEHSSRLKIKVQQGQYNSWTTNALEDAGRVRYPSHKKECRCSDVTQELENTIEALQAQHDLILENTIEELQAQYDNAQEKLKAELGIEYFLSNELALMYDKADSRIRALEELLESTAWKLFDNIS